jgi:hypothetical protein
MPISSFESRALMDEVALVIKKVTLDASSAAMG